MLNIHYLGDLIENIDLFLRYFCTTVYFNRMNVNIMFYMSFANSVPFDKNIDLTIDSIGQCLHRITESVLFTLHVLYRIMLLYVRYHHYVSCRYCIFTVLCQWCQTHSPTGGGGVEVCPPPPPPRNKNIRYLGGLFATFFFPCGGHFC